MSLLRYIPAALCLMFCCALYAGKTPDPYANPPRLSGLRVFSPLNLTPQLAVDEVRKRFAQDELFEHLYKALLQFYVNTEAYLETPKEKSLSQVLTVNSFDLLVLMIDELPLERREKANILHFLLVSSPSVHTQAESYRELMKRLAAGLERYDRDYQHAMDDLFRQQALAHRKKITGRIRWAPIYVLAALAAGTATLPVVAPDLFSLLFVHTDMILKVGGSAAGAAVVGALLTSQFLKKKIEEKRFNKLQSAFANDESKQQAFYLKALQRASDTCAQVFAPAAPGHLAADPTHRLR